MPYDPESSREKQSQQSPTNKNEGRSFSIEPQLSRWEFLQKQSAIFDTLQRSPANTGENITGLVEAWRSQLAPLVDPEQARNMDAAKSAEARAMLLDLAHRRQPGEDTEQGDLQENAHELFMESCARLYPGTKVTPDRINSALRSAIHQLSRTKDSHPGLAYVQSRLIDATRQRDQGKEADVSNIKKEAGYLVGEIARYTAEFGWHEIDLPPEQLGQLDLMMRAAFSLEQIAALEENKEQEPQWEPWVDREREQAFENEIEEIETALSMGKTPAQVLRSVLEYGLNKPEIAKMIASRMDSLSPEEQQDITVRFVESESLSKLAGKTVRRPIFIVKNEEVYKKLEGVLDQEPGSSHGLKFSSKLFGNLENWRDTGLIVSKDSEKTIIHEMTHSLDPHIEAREGYDKMIGELLAYFDQMLVNTGVEGWGPKEDKQEPGETDWDNYEIIVGNTGYYQRYSNQLKKKERNNDVMLEQSWSKLVQKAVEKVQQLRKDHGHQKTQRILAQTKTLKELLVG